MKRVVVIGSKPNAVIPEGDAVYCANASIAYYAQQIAGFKHIVNIVTSSAIDYQPKNMSDDRDYYRERWEKMSKTRPARLIILRNKNPDRMISALREVGYDASISFINDQDRRKLVTRVSGCDDPILTADFFQLPSKLKIAYAGSALSIILKRIFDQSKTCNAIFRPSTGIIALLYAMTENGCDCEYVVTGIGLKNRNEYIQANRSSEHRIPHHVFADRKVLHSVAAKYNVTTTEPELMGVLPQFTAEKICASS